MNVRCTLPLAALAALTLAGCGGGGGASSGSGPTPEANLPLFLTAGSPGAYDHLWLGIERIELVSADGSTTTVFAPAGGEQVDAATLADASGAKFRYLSNARVPAKDYTGARIHMNAAATVVLTGGNASQARTIAEPALSIAFGSSVRPGPQGMSLDLALARWTDDGARLHPSGQLGPRPSGDPNRHEFEDYHGTISGLTGESPNFRFTLSRPSGAFGVVCDASTRIYNSNGQPNATLTNGARVEVRGAFSTALNALAATEVKVHNGPSSGDDPHGLKGAPSAIDAVAGAFTVELRTCAGFVPPITSVRVQTSASTVFMTDGGVRITSEEFFAGLGSVPLVEVEGRFDTATNTLAATKCKFEDEGHGGPGGRYVEIKGTALNIAVSEGTFSINVAEYEGFIPPANPMPVRTTAATRFRNKDGDISREAFFAGLASAGRVKVQGSLDGGVLVAKQAKLER